jgi:hypothetical protein
VPVISFTEDWTTISTCESLTNFSGWGKTSGFGLEQDGVKEGNNWIGETPSVTYDSGYGYTAVGGIDLGNNLLGIWVFTIPGFLSTFSAHALYIRVSSSTTSWTADYNDYRVGGSDVLWCEKGWHFVVLDCNRTPDASAGSCNLASIQRVAMGRLLVATASKVPVWGYDLIQYGTKVEVTGPSSSDSGGNGLDFNDNGGSSDTITRDDAGSFVTDGWEIGDYGIIRGSANNDDVEFGPLTAVAAATLTFATGTLNQTDLNQTGATIYAKVTFQDIYDKDNADASYFGVVTLSQNGLWEVNYNLILGDESGAGDLWFASRGEKVVFPDQPLRSAVINQQIKAAEDTGETIIHFGQSTGTGDSRVGFGGSVVTQYNEQFSQGNKVDLSAAIEECDVFGSLFSDITNGATFAADTSHHVTNVSFDACGQIDLGSVEARNLTFSGYDSASDAALLWKTTTNLKNSRFLANRNAAGTASAIEHTTTTAATYYNLTFAGNDYDVNLTAASGTLNISKDGTSDPSTYKTGGSGTVVFIGTKPLTIHLEDRDGNSIQYAHVNANRTAKTAYKSSTGNSAGDGDIVVTPAIDNDVPAAGRLKVLDLDFPTRPQTYRWASWTGSTLTFRTEVTGTANTGGSGTTLKRKTGTGFLSADIEDGDTVRNTTDGSWTVVEEIVDDDTITTFPLVGGTDNTWQENDAYSFHKLATGLTNGVDPVEIPYLNEESDASGNVTVSVPNPANRSLTIRVGHVGGATPYRGITTTGAFTAAAGLSTTVVLDEDEVYT